MKVYGNTPSGWFVSEKNLTDVKWTSNNPIVATVNNKGEIMGLLPGKVTITAKYEDYVDTYEVDVHLSKDSHYILIYATYILIFAILVCFLIIIYKLYKKKFKN